MVWKLEAAQMRGFENEQLLIMKLDEEVESLSLKAFDSKRDLNLKKVLECRKQF